MRILLYRGGGRDSDRHHPQSLSRIQYRRATTGFVRNVRLIYPVRRASEAGENAFA